MRTKLLLMSVIMMMIINPLRGQSIRVIPVPYRAMNPSVPHFAYNGHPTTFKAMARNGNYGQVYYYRWDADGDGIYDLDFSGKSPMNYPGKWYQESGYRLGFVFKLPYVDPAVTSKKLFIATIQVTTSVDNEGKPTGPVATASYPVMVFADVPALSDANSATADQLKIMKEVAIDDALWALHKNLTLSGPPSAQMMGVMPSTQQALPNTALFALAMLENGHLGAYPPGTYNSYGITAPPGFLTNNDLRYNNDPYAEDVTRAINYLLDKVGQYGGVPADDESDDGAEPIEGTNDRTAFFVGDMQCGETLNSAFPVAAIAKSGLGGTAVQVGGSHIIGKSMEYVVQQLVDHIVYSQIDDATDMGGWSYSPNGSPGCSYMSGGWYYSLISAEQAMGQFGVYVNSRVKNRIPNFLSTNQDPSSGGPRWDKTWSEPVFEPAGLSLMACKWLGWDTFSASDDSPAGYPPYPTTPKSYYRRIYDKYLDYITQFWTTATSNFFYFSSNRVLWKDGNYNSASPCPPTPVQDWPKNLWTFSLFAVKQATQTGVPVSLFGTHDWRREFGVSLAKGQANTCDGFSSVHLDYYEDASTSLMSEYLGVYATTAFAVLAMSEQGQSRPIPVASASPREVFVACSGPTAGKVMFQHSGSFHPDPGLHIVEYRWNFNTAAGPIDWESIASGSYSSDGRGWKGSSPSATPFYFYTQAGTYNAELTVVDDQSPPQTNSALVTGIKVLPMTASPPTASAGGPYVVRRLASLILAGSATDPNLACGDLLTYAWDLNNDGNFGDAAGATPTLSWTQLVGLGLDGSPGQLYTIKLKVTDGTGLTNVASTTMTIMNMEPIASFTVQPPAGGCNVPVTFDASGSSVGDPQATIVSYAWDFGDGTNATGKIVVHSYLSMGSFTVSLTVTDNAGRTASATKGVSVTLVNLKPVANAGGPYVVSPGNALTLDGTLSSDPNSPCDAIASYSWDINNDNIFGDLTGPTPTIPASATSGWRVGIVYMIALRVTDNFGVTSDIAQTHISVTSAPLLTLPLNGATGVSVNPMTFAWNTFEGATSYTLQYSNDPGLASAVTLNNISNTSLQVAGLAYNTLYYWRVYATTVGGTSAWSYVWNFRTNKGTASVTPIAASKTYGTNDPPLSGMLAGFNTGDAVTATYTRTSGESVAGSPYTISATLSPQSVLDNYDITYNTASFTINKATVTANVTVESKAYDGTTGATIATRALSNVIGSDDVTLAGGSASFGDANAGDGKTVTASGFSLGGSAAGNYQLSATEVTTTANITKAQQTISWSNPADIVYGTALSSAQLNATASGVSGGSAPGTLSYTPAANTILSAGTGQTLSAAAAATENYNPATASVTINVLKATPVITWANPADISYGTLLSATQLNATTDVPGSFSYTPPAGAKLNAGSGQDLKADFTPLDQANHNTATKIVKINVLGGMPMITWANPADITYGTLLSATQLNATADVPGTFAYTPPTGTKLNAGAAQILKVEFTPSDRANYGVAAKTVTINVLKAAPVITWNNPPDITYGTLLSATQLNATADVPGMFVYSPPSGTKLNAGDAQNLKADFTPADAANYDEATKTVSILVSRATPTLAVTGGTFTYDGNPHAASASATGVGDESVSGSFSFTYTGTGSTTYGPTQTPPTNQGTYSASADFTSTSANYTNASGSCTLTIVKVVGQLPELLVRFDAQKKDIVVLDVLTSSPLGPQPSLPVKKQSNTEDRIYRFTNTSGIWIEIVVEVKNAGHSCQAVIRSIAYSNMAKTTPPDNALKVEWSTDNLGALKELQQKVELKPALQVEAKFDSKSSSTGVNIHQDGPIMDRGLTSPGLALIGLATDHGALRYNGPGSETTISSPSIAARDEWGAMEQSNDESAVPTEYALHNAYPNPFNPSTTIRFSLPQAARVQLTVHDMLGRQVAVLANEERPAGEHSVRLDAGRLSSGMYFYRLNANSFIQTKKLLLMK